MVAPRSVLLASVLAVSSGAQQGPRPTVVADEPSCPRCTVTTRVLVTLGTDDGVGSISGKPMSVNVDSRGRYWVFQELEPATVFSPTGAVDRVVGRKGSGPGEFQAADQGLAIGDSMLVVDWLSSRATMIGPDLNRVREVRIVGSVGRMVVVKWPDQLVMTGHRLGSQPPNSTLHRLSFATGEAVVVGSFGPAGTGGPMGNVAVSQVLAPARDGMWSTYWTRPEFTKWGADGRARLVLRRRFDWFPEDRMPGMGTPTAAPTARVAFVAEDAEGLLWTFVHTPAPTWRDAWPAGAGRGEVRIRDIGWDRMYRTHIEVIDPASARVVARHAFDGYVFDALPDRRVAVYRPDLTGIPRVQVVALGIAGR